MHLHHFTLRALANDLNSRLRGSVLGECFSQSKDELVLGFEKGAAAECLRVSCEGTFQFICPFPEFRKARKNTVTLFPEILGLKVKEVSAPAWERLLLITFENEWTLALKMHGLQSNVILLKSGNVHSLFRTSVEADQNFVPRPGAFDENWKELSCGPGETVAEHLKKISPVLDRNFAEFVDARMKTGAEFNESLQSALEAATDDNWHIAQRAGRLKFLIFADAAGPSRKIKGVMSALQLFVRSRYVYEKYASEYNRIASPLEKQIKKVGDLESSARKGIAATEAERNPEEIGNILMAQLHLITKGVTEIELDDYYLGGKLKVKLKPELEPQQNATSYYQKSKKLKNKLLHLRQQQEQNAQRLARLLEVKEKFSAFIPPASLVIGEEGIDAQELRKIESFLQENEAIVVAGGDIAAQEKKHPFMEFNREGFSIFVGRSAKSNDELTFHFSKREDLWLHVKDGPGSHVIIRKRLGREFPKGVIEFAASLAAGYSSRKTEGMVSVSFTLRKHVRKPKGAVAGLVIVDKEDTVLVEPYSV